MTKKRQEFIENFEILINKLYEKYQKTTEQDLIKLFTEKVELIPYYSKFKVFIELYKVIDLVEIQNDAIDILKQINTILSTTVTVSDIMLRYNEIFTASIDDCIFDKISVMKENDYNLLPIMDESKMVGLFTDNSLNQVIVKDNIFEINKTMTFEDIIHSLELNNFENSIQFIKSSLPANELSKSYTNSFKKGEYITAYFVTQDGTINGNLIGLVTPYRIARIGIYGFMK